MIDCNKTLDKIFKNLFTLGEFRCAFYYMSSSIMMCGHLLVPWHTVYLLTKEGLVQNKPARRTLVP